MPDGTLQELLAGFNQMQAQLGLMPGGTQPVSGQLTPPMQVKHPGEISQELNQIITQQVQQQTQRAEQTRSLPPPNVVGLLPTPPAAGEYGKQFRQRMEQIESSYIEPQRAQQFAAAQGQPGFQYMPSPVFQTAPSMGIYRPTAPAPTPPLGMPPGGIPPTPIVTPPFAPSAEQVQPQFMTPFQRRHHLEQIRQEQSFAEGMSAVPTAAYFGAGAVTTGVGMTMGRRAGERIAEQAMARGAGAGAMRVGRMGGRIGGLLAGAAVGFGAIGRGAEALGERATEAPIEQRAFGRQLQDISQQFVVGGPDLAETGRGFNTQAAVRTAGQMQRGVEQGQMSGFNMRDLMSITQQAADQGMLDMAQSGGQMLDQVRNVARGLRNFMQIAQEPNVRQAMQMMGQMRTMGLSVPETNVAMSNAQQFARMAGTTVQGVMEQGGLPGAMTFQRLGMTAGLGAQVGMAGQAMAGQAVSGGAFTPAQLAMAGGRQGLAQTVTEAAGAGLGVDFPILSMLTRGAEGQLTIDPERMQQVMSGQMSLSQQAAMGAENVQRLGGERVLMELSTRMNEIRDELGRNLGPQGSVLLALRQATNLMREVPSLSLGGAARMLGMGPQQARAMEIMGQSPRFWEGLQRQHRVNISEAREEETLRRDRMRETSTLSHRFGRWWESRGVIDRMREMGRDAVTSVAEWYGDREQAIQAAERGETLVTAGRGLEVQDEEINRSLDRFVEGGGMQRFWQRHRDELKRSDADQAIARGTRGTFGEGLRGGWNTMQFFGRAVASIIPITRIASMAAETTGLADITTVEGGAQNMQVRAQRALGGVEGWMAEQFPQFTEAANFMDPMGQVKRRLQVEMAESAARAGFAMQRGEQMTSKEATDAGKEFRKKEREYYREAGLDTSTPKKKHMESRSVEAIVDVFRSRSSMFGDKPAMEKDLKEAVIQARIDQGEKPELARRIVDENWSQMAPGLLRRAQREAPEAAQASIAKTLEATGFKGAQAGKNLEMTMEQLEKIEETAKEEMGFYEGIDASRKSWEEFTKTMTTTDEDTIMLMQAQALRQEGNDEEARAIEDSLEARLGPDKMSSLREKLGRRMQRMTEEQREMYVESGMKLAKVDPQKMQETVQKWQTTLKGTRAGAQVAKGVARMVEQGFKAFEQMQEKGLGDEGAMATLERLAGDERSLEQLAKRSPGMARLAREYGEAESEEERRTVARKLTGMLGRRGRGERGAMRLGGRGVGGRREAREEEMIGREEDIREAIASGDSQKAFAQSVPVLAKASTSLLEVSDKLEKTIQAVSIMFRLPGKY